jgi:hypothetical protein
MVLKKKHKLTLLPTPYLKWDALKDMRRPLRSRKQVEYFYSWLYQHFQDKKFMVYEVAKALDVHRLVAMEWLNALDEIAPSAVNFVTGGFLVKKPRELLPIIVVKKDEYDPWTNREYDDCIKSLWMPYFIDEIVDKYYYLYEDEVLENTGKRRQYPDGSYFVPPINARYTDDHPINLTEKAKKHFAKKEAAIVPNGSRRERIEARCKGAIDTPAKEIKSWLPEKFFKDEFGEPEGGVAKTNVQSSNETPVPSPRKGIIRRQKRTK